jgi:hypothetical protein
MPTRIAKSNGNGLAVAIALRAIFTLLSFLLIADCQAQQLVVIHYSNNTAPAGKNAENHKITIERLQHIENEKAHSIAENLRSEPQLMATALLADRSILEAELAGRLKVILCEFDNPGVRRGTFDYWLPSDAMPRQGVVRVPTTGDYIFDDNPLATAAGLQASLGAVAELFPPSSHRFVLITQSHGSRELALTVKLARKHEDVPIDVFQAMFDGDTVTYDLPTVGVTKSEYFDVLRTLGNKIKMQFSLVVLETCKGTIEQPLVRELPENVDLFFSSGNRSLEFRSLPYAEIFSKVQSIEELIPAFDQYLKEDFLRIHRTSKLPIWTWVVPLIFVLLSQWLSMLWRKRYVWR